MKKSVKRALVSLYGLAIFLILLEISLRLVGSGYAFMSESSRPQTAECDTTILAVGDSVTFGIGAPRGFSYPAQLQQMLNDQKTDTCYTVINRGRPGQNSAQILAMLESWLREFHPDIVTVLIGAQNQVNYYGYQDYLATKKIVSSGWLKLHDYLNRIRVYRFIRFLAIDIRNSGRSSRAAESRQIDEEPLAGELEVGRNLQTGLYVSDSRPEEERKECKIGAEYRENGNWEKSHEALLEQAAAGVLTGACYNMIGSVYREKNQPELAIPWFLKGVEQDPSFYENYEEIGGIYYEQGRVDEALTWFQKGIQQAAPDTLHDQSYINIGRAFTDTGRIHEAARFFEQEKIRLNGKNKKLSALVEDYLLMFSENVNNVTIHDWILSDVSKIVDLCQQYHAQVIMQNYPYEPKVNPLFGQIAEKKGLLFVDQEKTFEKYTTSGKRDPEVFVPDGHPNTIGYKMMAGNLFRVFVDGSLGEKR